jgi:hypothetical protein
MRNALNAIESHEITLVIGSQKAKNTIRAPFLNP